MDKSVKENKWIKQALTYLKKYHDNGWWKAQDTAVIALAKKLRKAYTEGLKKYD